MASIITGVTDGTLNIARHRMMLADDSELDRIVGEIGKYFGWKSIRVNGRPYVYSNNRKGRN